MEQKSSSSHAAAMDVQTKLKEEACARGVEQRSSYAAVMDAQIKSSREAGAEGMGPRSSYVAMDAQT